MEKIDLSGTWQLTWNDGQRGMRPPQLAGPGADLSRALEATVPGEVHLDLERAGLLEDINTGIHVLHARWVEETKWNYRRTFSARPLAPGERAFLVFEGIDHSADITLNGRAVAHHSGAFTPLRAEVTALLAAGENVLLAEVEAGLFEAADRPGSGYGMTFDNAAQKRNWLRKTQSNFGWDWSPRLLNVGITGPVHLDIETAFHVHAVSFVPDLSADLRTGTLAVRAVVEGLDDRTRRGTFRAEVAGTGAAVETAVEIRPGRQTLAVRLTVPEPSPWWPVGHGAQPLYEACARLAIQGEPPVEIRRRVGFRRVRVNQDPHPGGGRYFVIEVNGKPIFAKGGNWVPADLVIPRIDRARYAELIDRALEANANMLRIWGGGLYEHDDFYDLCDERGVLVWQEFIFACAKYPAHDEQFLARVRAEAEHHVRRLARHPSLVAWCGNNEIEWGYHGWGYDRGVALPDHALYHLELPRILKREDGTRHYQPSSPFSPDHEVPNRDDVGDQHPWSVGFANTDFRDYRAMACRFPNEGGILGPTALPTVRACLRGGPERRNTFLFDLHDNGIAAWHDQCWPDQMLAQWLGRDIGAMSIEEYVYYAGAVQGEGLSEYIRNFRRRMFSSSSAIFWMYNDCWPATRSWTIIDYYRRRTPAFWPVRRAFAPLAVALAAEGGRLKVFGVNEGPEWAGTLRAGLFALAGGLPVDSTVPVQLAANASTLLMELPLADWERLGTAAHGAFAILSAGGREVARDRLFLPLLRELKWPKASVRLEREGERVTFSSPTFAWRVCLDLDGELPLPDNFFDVLPGIPTVLDWPESLPAPQVLRVGNLA